MSQPSIASFFNSRKRPATDDIISTKNKVFLTESTINAEYLSSSSIQKNSDSSVVCPRYFLNVDQCKNISGKNTINNNNLLQYYSPVPSLENEIDNQNQLKCGIKTRSGRSIKRTVNTALNTEITDISKAKTSKNITEELSTKKVQQQKLVEFVKKGYLSPKNKLTPIKDANQTFSTKETNINKTTANVQQKDISNDNIINEKEKLKKLVKKELNFDEVKLKLTRSAKLHELKASLGRIKELEKTRKAQEERNKLLKYGEPTKSNTAGLTLKEFKTIELEVLTSPRKGLSTPTKLIPRTPDKNELMSPKRTATPKRLLFSPSKDGSPSKIIVPPAYQRFLNLAESSTTTALQLPYKYRFLIEVFKCVDSVAAMFFNRKEIITFKKLRPAVQRMLRKNFHELHLAQIKNLYPDAFTYHQMKMRNYGSISKQDYFQLVITPNIDGICNNEKIGKIDEDNILKSAQSNAMNPQVMIERHQKFYNILLQKVKIEHEKFLISLDPPLVIPNDKIRRWHPEFDLENCPDIEMGHLPQPPNVEKYSSAKDILSTARNLFNCTTPLERVMNRYELAKSDPQKQELLEPVSTTTKTLNITSNNNNNDSIANATATLLKGVPKSLLDKIRAKQAAKALDTITRRPSQDSEAKKFSRLPELARHLRNVFITEKKSVLPLENVIKKIENSYRTCLTQQDIECHLKLIAKQCPNWIVFHDIRNTVYLKMSRDLDLAKIIEKLEKTANEKLK